MRLEADEIAKARRAGGFGVDLAKLAVPGAAGVVVSGVSTTGDVVAVLRDSPPAEVDRFADKRFAKAGVREAVRGRFLGNRRLR